MRIAILGFGREGRAVFKFLKGSPEYRGAKIEIRDKKRSKNYLKNLARFDVVFRSPGVPWNLPELARARKAGVKFSSATQLFFEHFPRKNIIGVTGTKGKGTTTTLLYRTLKAAGKSVHLAGNIGTPALTTLRTAKKRSLVILELSSFQLQDLDASPHIAAILDIFPDHQDAHRNLAEYYSAKTNIGRHQKKDDAMFYFKRNAMSRKLARKSRGRKIAVDEKKFELFAPSDLKIPGPHNFKNAVMAATIALHLGTPKRTIATIAKRFGGNEHRLEFTRKMGGIKFYNDSASTNPQTAAAAIRAFPAAAKILIAGGQDKNLDYAPLARTLKNSGTELVVLYGENKKKIADALGGKRAGVKITKVADLRAAIRTAYMFAKRSAARHPDIIVLFSPAATSFDQFRDYAERGRYFKKLVHKLRI